MHFAACAGLVVAPILTRNVLARFQLPQHNYWVCSLHSCRKQNRNMEGDSGWCWVELWTWECRDLITHICLWPSTSWDRTSPGWCTAHPSAAPGLGASWVRSCTLLWRSYLQRVPAAQAAEEVKSSQVSPKSPKTRWWRRHYEGWVLSQGCVTVCTSIGVGGRGFLDALRWEFQVNPVNDMI